MPMPLPSNLASAIFNFGELVPPNGVDLEDTFAIVLQAYKGHCKSRDGRFRLSSELLRKWCKKYNSVIDWLQAIGVLKLVGNHCPGKCRTYEFANPTHLQGGIFRGKLYKEKLVGRYNDGITNRKAEFKKLSKAGKQQLCLNEKVKVRYNRIDWWEFKPQTRLALEAIRQGNLFASEDKDGGGRIYHNISSLKKEARKALYLNGEPLVEFADIRASQPVCLAIAAEKIPSISLQERRKFQEWCRDGFYEKLMESVCHHGGHSYLESAHKSRAPGETICETRKRARDMCKGEFLKWLNAKPSSWLRWFYLALDAEFPGFCHWIYRTKKEHGNNQISIIFRRTETDLIRRRFLPANTDIDIVDFHDGLGCQTSVARHAYDRFREYLDSMGMDWIQLKHPDFCKIEQELKLIHQSKIRNVFTSLYFVRQSSWPVFECSFNDTIVTPRAQGPPCVKCVLLKRSVLPN